MVLVDSHLPSRDISTTCTVSLSYFIYPFHRQLTRFGLLDTHYAEGTLAPLLVNRLIFSIVPDRSPLLIRPIVRMVFNTLLAQMVDPRLQANATMVRPRSLTRLFISCTLQLEAHLSKKPGKFFAGGDSLSSADFMMTFGLEGLIARSTSTLGENIRAYVERVHDR
jgi:glutathione S-transferase